MKILQLVTKRQFRGAEVFAAELSCLLEQRGYDVSYVGLYKAPENVLTAKNVNNIDLNGKKGPFSISLLFSLIRLLKKQKPDIIQANGSDTLKYLVFARYFSGNGKIVYRNISMVSSWSKSASIKRKFNRFLFKKVDCVTSVGQEALDDLVKTYNYPAHKTKLIRRGIPQFEVDKGLARKTLATRFGFFETDDILVHIGRFSTEKNHPFLVKCVDHLLKSKPKIRLIFIGEGEQLPQIKTLVERKGLSEKIFFAGHCDNVQELLAGCDLFLLASTIEGVPGVVLEAGMQGIPAIAVKVGGVGEVVKNDETGILIDSHDRDLFCTGVTSLLNDPLLRKRLGENAKTFVINNYGLRHCVEQFEELYAGILNNEI